MKGFWKEKFFTLFAENKKWRYEMKMKMIVMALLVLIAIGCSKDKSSSSSGGGGGGGETTNASPVGTWVGSTQGTSGAIVSIKLIFRADLTGTVVYGSGSTSSFSYLVSGSNLTWK